MGVHPPPNRGIGYDPWPDGTEDALPLAEMNICFYFLLAEKNMVWVKNSGAPKQNPGKRKKPVVPWWFNFDPSQYFLFSLLVLKGSYHWKYLFQGASANGSLVERAAPLNKSGTWTQPKFQLRNLTLKRH